MMQPTVRYACWYFAENVSNFKYQKKFIAKTCVKMFAPFNCDLVNVYMHICNLFLHPPEPYRKNLKGN